MTKNTWRTLPRSIRFTNRQFQIDVWFHRDFFGHLTLQWTLYNNTTGVYVESGYTTLEKVVQVIHLYGVDRADNIPWKVLAEAL